MRLTFPFTYVYTFSRPYLPDLLDDDLELLLLLEEDLELDPDLADEDRLDLEDLEMELLDRLEEPELDR